MKWAKWGLLALLAVAAVVVFSTNIFQKKYTYYYYPEWNAYYDEQHKNYIYSIDGGKTWDTITNSSNSVANILGEKIVLRSTSSQIWMDNAAHRQRYGGTLNDLVGGFLKTEEDKRPIRKKNSAKDSSNETINTTENVTADSINEVEEWIHETKNQENTAKEKLNEEQETKSSEEQEPGNKPEHVNVTATDSAEHN